jgi:ABC-type uncharacterized transport system auxiliary subunit
MEYDEYNRWIEPPREMVTLAFFHAFQKSKLFRHVGPAAALDRPDFTLDGELLRFNEVEEKGGRRAEFGVYLELRKQKDRALLWSSVISTSREIGTTGPKGLAEAMSAAVEEAASRAVSAVTAVKLR